MLCKFISLIKMLQATFSSHTHKESTKLDSQAKGKPILISMFLHQLQSLLHLITSKAKCL
jgi:hypothetical protein